MRDLVHRFGGNQQTACFGDTQRQSHQIDLFFLHTALAVGFLDHIDGIRPGRQQFQLTAVGTKLILAVQNKAAQQTAFSIIFSAFLFTVDHAVAQFGIVPAEVIQSADKLFFRQGDDFIFAVFGHADQTVKLVADHGIIALDLGSDIAVFAVPADFDIIQGRLLTVDFVKVFDFRAAGIVFAIFCDQFFQIIHGVIVQVGKIFPQLLHRIKDLAQFTLVLFDVKPADPADRQGKQFVHILIGNVPHQQRTVGGKAGVDLLILLFLAAALFDAFVDAVLKEQLGKRFGEKEFRLTAILVFQLKVEVFQQFFRIADDHIMHGHLGRTAVADHCHIDRNRHGAVGVHVKCLQGLFRIGSAHGDHPDLDVFRSIIVDAGNTDLVLFRRLFNGGHQAFGRGRGGDLTDDQFPAVDVDLGTEYDLAVSVIVFPGIHQAALLEVRIKFKRFAPQCGDLCLQQFVEVVGHDPGRHSNGNTVAAQHQQ